MTVFRTVRWFVMIGLICVTSGCTATPGTAGPARAPAVSASTAIAETRTTCTTAEIQTAITGFFRTWNHREPLGFSRLFAPDAAFAFAGKHQDTITQGANGYTEVGGRQAILALAEHQWATGERLAYRDIEVVVGPGVADNGGGATVVAFFPDGTTQPMEESKFVYDCSAHAFEHVVIISGTVARHGARPWSWRMPYSPA